MEINILLIWGVENMLKSINNVSKELGISKATIYKRLKEEKYKKLIIK